MKTTKGVRPIKRIASTHKSPTNDTASRGSVTIQITTTRGLTQLLDRVVETGFFGNSRAAAAERLLAEAIRGLLREGTIQKRNKVFETEAA